MFEAARAHAAADGRDKADMRDIRAVAPMTLRQRQSQFMIDFFRVQQQEDDAIRTQIDAITAETATPAGDTPQTVAHGSR